MLGPSCRIRWSEYAADQRHGRTALRAPATGQRPPMPRTDLTWRSRRLDEGYYTSLVEAPDNPPVRTFLPIGYEPNYPYPLLVFLHGNGGNEEQVLRLAPRVSRRNYICIGLRAPNLVDTR